MSSSLAVKRPCHDLLAVKSNTKEALMATKKLRRILQLVLVLNFMIGMAEGMGMANVIAVMANGTAVLALISVETKER